MEQYVMKYINETKEKEQLAQKLKMYNDFIQKTIQEQGGFNFLFNLSEGAKRVLRSEIVYAERFHLEYTLYLKSENHVFYVVTFAKKAVHTESVFSVNYKDSNSTILEFSLRSENATDLKNGGLFNEQDAKIIRSALFPYVDKMIKIVENLTEAQNAMYESAINKMLEGKVISRIEWDRGIPHIVLETEEKFPLRELNSSTSNAYYEGIFKRDRRIE